MHAIHCLLISPVYIKLHTDMNTVEHLVVHQTLGFSVRAVVCTSPCYISRDVCTLLFLAEGFCCHLFIAEHQEKVATAGVEHTGCTTAGSSQSCAVSSPRTSPRKRLSRSPTGDESEVENTGHVSAGSEVENTGHVSAGSSQRRTVSTPRTSPRKRLPQLPNAEQGGHRAFKLTISVITFCVCVCVC